METIVTIGLVTERTVRIRRALYSAFPATGGKGQAADGATGRRFVRFFAEPRRSEGFGSEQAKSAAETTCLWDTSRLTTSPLLTSPKSDP